MCLLVSFRGASRQVLPGELSPAVLSIYSKLSKSNRLQNANGILFTKTW